MKRVLLVAASVVLAASVAQAALIWDNGPFITHPNGGVGGKHASLIQTPGTIYGWNINHALAPNNFRIADDFTVKGPEDQLTEMLWYGYQTGAGGVPTFTGAYIRIWDGPPGGGGNLLYGDGTTNRIANAPGAFEPNFYGPTGIYRVSAVPGDANRAVMEIKINMAWVPALTVGKTYWVDVGLTGSLASGPWANPVVPHPPGANSRQHNSGVWTALLDGTYAADMPFKMYAVPEPASLGLLLLGAALLRRR